MSEFTLPAVEPNSVSRGDAQKQQQQRWSGNKKQSQLMLELSMMKQQTKEREGAERYQSKVLALKTRVDKLSYQAKQIQAHNAQFRRGWLQNGSAEQNLRDLEVELSLAHEELMKKDQVIERLNNQIRNASWRENNDATHTAHTEIAKLEIAKLENSYKELKAENEKLKAQIDELHRTHHNTEEELNHAMPSHRPASAPTSASKIEQVMKQLQAEKVSMQTEVQQLRTDVYNLEHGITVENLKQENLIMMGSVGQLREKVADLTTKLEKSRREIHNHDMLVHESLTKLEVMDDKEADELIDDAVASGNLQKALSALLSSNVSSVRIANKALLKFTIRVKAQQDKNQQSKTAAAGVEGAELTPDKPPLYKQKSTNPHKAHALDIIQMVQKMVLHPSEALNSRRASRISQYESGPEVVRPSTAREEALDYDCFLGGSCNPTNWRSEIALVELKKHNVKYYNPQRSDWSPALVEVEAHAKEAASVLLFVIDKQTRAIGSMLEAVEHISRGRLVVLSVQQIEEGSDIGGVVVVGNELKDLNRARSYLVDIARRHECPCFTDENSIEEAIQSVITKIKDIKLMED